MSPISNSLKRAGLGTALGLAAAIALAPSTASALAAYEAFGEILGISLGGTEGWSLDATITDDGFNGVTSVGAASGSTSRTGTGGPGEASALSAQGQADAPGGEIEEYVFNEITIAISNDTGQGSSDVLTIDFALGAFDATNLPGEEASALAIIELFDSAGNLLDSLQAVNTDFSDAFDVTVSLPNAGDSIEFAVLMQVGGRACSPGAGASCVASPVSEPETLALLGLGVLAVGLRRRRPVH